jgi:serine/threonine protein kinase/Tol biopolymer transport system component
MTPERMKKLQELFDAALDRAPAERAAFLAEACGNDQALRRAVESLLLHHEQANSFIESPPAVVAADLFADEPSESLTGQSIGRYKLLELLGAGGMGEVYLAQDTSLGRKVALKLLPARFTTEPDRLRRFEQEARTASALNHPNIVTIYEIGQVGETHFIATEYLDGVTLRAHLSATRVNAPEALEIAGQVASALAAAHARGIVHRDIKPENIMVLKDSYSLHRENYVKLLDFGIAKLTEATSAKTEAPTKRLIQTNQGVVLGTVSYMSPEQARAVEVDARTDLWSLGVVLYEMVTSQIPFAGDTAEDMRAAILKDKPLPLSSAVPERLKWIVEKALRKDREDRYQTAREFFSDLRELQQQESTSNALREPSVAPEAGAPRSSTEPGDVPPTSTGATGTAAVVTPRPSSAEYIVTGIRRHKRGALLGLAALAIAFTVIAFAIYKWRTSTTANLAVPFQAMKIMRLTDSGKATAAAISPDGNYVVYALENGGRQSLWLRQVSPTSEREIVAPSSTFIRGLTFSKDGNLIYYTAGDRDSVWSNNALYQVPTLGGTPRKLLAAVSSAVTFSPDGSRIAFVHDNQSTAGGETQLKISNADGTGERVLAQHKGNLFFQDSGPAWSPDGEIIACAAGIDPDGIYNTVVGVSVADGTEKPITSYRGWMGRVDRVTWLSDNSGLIVVAATNLSTGSQIWHLAYPSGKVRRITNDLNDYGIDSLTLTSDMATMAAVQQDQTANFWLMMVNEDASRARQITHGKFSGGGGGLTWTPDGKIVFPRRTGDIEDLWIMDRDGTNQRQLTADPSWEVFPTFSPDGRYLVLNSNRVNISHIWRFNADGTNPKQLTDGNSEDYSPVFTPDGQWVLFASWRSGKLATWKVSIEGGEPVQLAHETSPWPAVSPNGKLFASGYHDNDPNTEWRLAVYPIEGGQPGKLFKITSTTKFGPGLSWTPDGQTLIYVDTLDGVSNIWSQPINGSPKRQLTNFKSDLILRFALSPDGRQLVLRRGTETRDVVLIQDSK